MEDGNSTSIGQWIVNDKGHVPNMANHSLFMAADGLWLARRGESRERTWMPPAGLVILWESERTEVYASDKNRHSRGRPIRLIAVGHSWRIAQQWLTPYLLQDLMTGGHFKTTSHSTFECRGLDQRRSAITDTCLCQETLNSQPMCLAFACQVDLSARLETSLFSAWVAEVGPIKAQAHGIVISLAT